MHFIARGERYLIEDAILVARVAVLVTFGGCGDDARGPAVEPAERLGSEGGLVAGDQPIVDLDLIALGVGVERGGMDAGVRVKSGEAQPRDPRRLEHIVQSRRVEGAEVSLDEQRLASAFGKRRRRGRVWRDVAVRHRTIAAGSDMEHRFASRACIGERGSDRGDQCLARRLKSGAGQILLLQVDQQQGGAAHSG